MPDIITSPRYDQYRTWIQNARDHKLDWPEIEAKGTRVWLESQASDQFWPPINEQQWKAIVAAQKHAEESSLQASVIEEDSSDEAILGPEIDAAIQASQSERSTWMLYKKRLESSGWKTEDIQSLEHSSLETLKRMRRDTHARPPVKGLVVGHVQSGKTANMAGLMAIGSDNGYNLFIILSGTIEALRQQTQKRLLRDLNFPECPKNLEWRSLEHLGLNSPDGEQASHLAFHEGSHSRHMTVSLKNVIRLKNLKKWLTKDPHKLKQMRIVIIDDEADQASINTAALGADTPSKINSCIVELTKLSAQSVNYISYTATPYANFLNESYPESLYPKDFIITLAQSKDHFGPAQVFGIEGVANRDGLDIIRTIPAEQDANDICQIKRLHSNANSELPESLQSAIAWFISAAAARSLWKQNEPTSMLIHTSRNVEHHKNTGTAVMKWLSETPREELLAYCQKVWANETTAFTREDFHLQFPDYGLSETIAEYPDFKAIQPGIETLLSRITNIPLDEKGIPEYHRGIHVCIDNSENNGINDDNELVRLFYPQDVLAHSTAFIVIGGSTLARGLTIKGLVSTYFLRDSNQIDTLMQMGRWFGYRRNYELLPRIWMTIKCRKKFDYMSLVEKELREDLKGYMTAPHWRPEYYAPRVLNSSAFCKIRPSAKNKMKHAEPIDFDFSGANSQTTIFSSERPILEQNIDQTESFLLDLQSLPVSRGTSLIWENVQFGPIRNFLENFNFQERGRFFASIKAFCEWFEKIKEKAGYSEWSVVVGGLDSDKHGSWKIGEYSVNMISRSRLKRASNKSEIAIGVLRDPKDLLADADLPESFKYPIKPENSTIQNIRNEAGLAKTPQLLIYRIAKGSKAPEGLKTRADLDADADVIGISIWIPGVRNRHNGNPDFSRKLHVRLEEVDDSDDSDFSTK